MEHTAESFKIGDYLLAELQGEREPFWICKIEEIQKISSTDIKLKVKLFYRRRHIPSHLIAIADKYTDSFLHQEEFDWSRAELSDYKPNYVKLHYKLLQRFLFNTKETVLITPNMIRGKCYVFLLTVVDSPMDVLAKENNFFFILGYDAAAQEIHEDKGSIMLGSRYQARLPEFSINLAEEDKDTIIWDPARCSDVKYDQLCAVSRSLQELRNLVCYHPRTASLNPHSDHQLFSAMDVLHKSDYSISSVPAVLARSTSQSFLEGWSGDERIIFERALLKMGKQFREIRQEFLPWKSHEAVIRYYYHWKGTDGYRVWKAQFHNTSGELKELNICLKDWTFPACSGKEEETGGGKCPGCKRAYKEGQGSWYSWGPEHAPRRICWACSVHWRRYGGFLDAPELENLSWDSNTNSDSPSSRIFLCKECGRSFKSKSNLRRHELLAHTNKRERVVVWMCGREGVRSRERVGVRRLRVAARRPFTLILAELP